MAVTVPDEVLAVAKRDVESGTSPSLSAWVTEAAEMKARRESLAVVLDDLLREAGRSLSTEEEARARSRL